MKTMMSISTSLTRSKSKQRMSLSWMTTTSETTTILRRVHARRLALRVPCQDQGTQRTEMMPVRASIRMSSTTLKPNKSST